MKFLFNIILLLHPSLKIKSAAAVSLGKKRYSLAVLPLKHALKKDANTPIADILTWAIANIGTEKSVLTLSDMLDSSHNILKQYYAARYLEQLIGSSGHYYENHLKKAISFICVNGNESDVETVIRYLNSTLLQYSEGFLVYVIDVITMLLARTASKVETKVLQKIVGKANYVTSIHYGATTTRYSKISITDIKNIAASELSKRENCARGR